MKLLAASFLILISALVALAQTPDNSQDPPDVTVVKFSWDKERIGWQRDPFSPPVESNDEMRIRARDEKRIEEAKKSGSSVDVNRAERDARADAAIAARMRQQAPPGYAYRYTVTLRNSSAKTIKAVDWDYIFFERDTEVEIGRHQFASEEKIRPGKNGELEMMILAPPTQTISADALSKRKGPYFDERVVLMRIEYSDGTVWQRQ
ncbi:MAG TPA: hypothetical protein VF544_25475 [Pyrinomonadaceae bacterium]|jgi:hypothetical protein